MTPEAFDPLKQHRRDVRRQIVFPLMAVLLALMGLLVGLFALFAGGSVSAQQIGVVAACMMTVFILLPMVIVFLILDAVFVALLVGMEYLPPLIQKPLEKLHQYTARGNKITQDLSQTIAQPIIKARTRSAQARQTLFALLGLSQSTGENAHDKK